MNLRIDPYVKSAFDEILARTPDLGPTPTDAPASWEQPGPNRRPWLAVAAVALVVVGIGGVALLANRPEPVDSVADQPDPAPAPSLSAAPNEVAQGPCSDAGCDGFDRLAVVAGASDFYVGPVDLGQATLNTSWFDTLTRCVELAADFGSCQKIEGIAGVSLAKYPSDPNQTPPVNTSSIDTDNPAEISIGTTFTDLTPTAYADEWGPTQGGGTQQDVTVRGHDAIRYENENDPAVVWQESPRVLVWVVVPADRAADLMAIASGVRRVDGPASIPNRVVINELSEPWDAQDNDGDGLIVASYQGQECIGLNYVDTCGNSIDARTIVRAAGDGSTTVAGSAPAEAVAIRIDIAGADPVVVETISFANQTSRYFNTNVPAGNVQTVTWLTGVLFNGDGEFVDGTELDNLQVTPLAPDTETARPMTSASPGGQPASVCTVPGGCGTYIVQPGDYPIGVAERFCITLTELLAANGWATAATFPAPDVTIMIPPDDGRQSCPDPST